MPRKLSTKPPISAIATISTIINAMRSWGVPTLTTPSSSQRLFFVNALHLYC